MCVDLIPKMQAKSPGGKSLGNLSHAVAGNFRRSVRTFMPFAVCDFHVTCRLGNSCQLLSGNRMSHGAWEPCYVLPGNCIFYVSLPLEFMSRVA